MPKMHARVEMAIFIEEVVNVAYLLTIMQVNI